MNRARQLVRRTWHPCLMDSSYVEKHLVSGRTYGHTVETGGKEVTLSEAFETNFNHFAHDKANLADPVDKNNSLVATKPDVNRKSAANKAQSSDWRPRAASRMVVNKDKDFGKEVGSVNGAHFAATLDLGLRAAGSQLEHWGDRVGVDNELEWQNGAFQCFYRCLKEAVGSGGISTKMRGKFCADLQKEYPKSFQLITTAIAQPNANKFAGSAVLYFGEEAVWKDMLRCTKKIEKTTTELDGKKKDEDVLKEVYDKMNDHMKGARVMPIFPHVWLEGDKMVKNRDLWITDLLQKKPTVAQTEWLAFKQAALEDMTDAGKFDAAKVALRDYLKKVITEGKDWVIGPFTLTNAATEAVKLDTDTGKNLDSNDDNITVINKMTSAFAQTKKLNWNIFHVAVGKAADPAAFPNPEFEKFLAHCVGPMFKYSSERDCVLQELRAIRADVCPDDRNNKEVKANIVKIDPAETGGPPATAKGHPHDLSWRDFAPTLNRWTPPDHCRSAFVHANLCPVDMVSDASQRILFAKVFNMLEGSIQKGLFRTAATVLAQTAKENSCGIGDDTDMWP